MVSSSAYVHPCSRRLICYACCYCPADGTNKTFSTRFIRDLQLVEEGFRDLGSFLELQWALPHQWQSLSSLSFTFCSCLYIACISPGYSWIKSSSFSYILFNIVPTIADIIIAVIFFFSTFNFYFGAIVLVTMALYLGKALLQQFQLRSPAAPRRSHYDRVANPCRRLYEF